MNTGVTATAELSPPLSRPCSRRHHRDSAPHSPRGAGAEGGVRGGAPQKVNWPRRTGEAGRTDGQGQSVAGGSPGSTHNFQRLLLSVSRSRFQKEMWLFCAEPEMNIQEVGKITSSTI